MKRLFTLLTKETFIIPTIGILLLGGSIGVIVTIIFYLKDGLINNSAINPNAIGTFGDFIGGFIGTFFALATALLVWITFQSQKAELIATKNILEQQHTTQSIQQFESKFFSLLDIYNEVLKSLEVTGYRGGNSFIFTGKQFFSVLEDELQSEYIFDYHLEQGLTQPSGVAYYEKLYSKYKRDLAHYFRVLYRIFKYIDSTESLSIKEKWFYTKTIRSQLSEGELFLLYYNSFTLYGKNFKTLSIKYNLLKHLPIIDMLEIRRFFKEEFAYQKTVNGVFKKYPFNEQSAIDLMKDLLSNFDEIIKSAVLGRKEIKKPIYYDSFIRYDIAASYQDHILTIKLFIDVHNQHVRDNFYTKFGLSPNDERLLMKMLTELLFIITMQNSFFEYQVLDDVLLKMGRDFQKRKPNLLDNDNVLWASIERKDKEDFRIVRDLY
jgi:hypothetical protein